MQAGLTARIVSLFARFFPERQIYHRSDGRVQFVVLSPRFQVVSLFVGLSVLSWIAYASVMTAFKDNIIAAKERRVQELQQRYETEIARMRLDYDDLSGKLALAEDRFATTVAAIEKRQGELQTAMADQTSAGDALDEVKRRAGTVRALGLGPDPQHIDNEEDPSAAGGAEHSDGEGDAADEEPAAPPPAASDAKQDKSASLEPARQPVYVDDAPVPLEKPDHLRIASADEARPAESDTAALTGTPSDFTASGRNLPAGESFAALETRLDSVTDRQQEIAADLANAATIKEQELRDIIGVAGINADAIAPRADSQGGPFIPIGDTSDPFQRDPNLDAADATLERVETLQKAMLAIPFANPIPTVTRISSGFGGRSDPFTGGRAFHSGLDFKGPFATDILATAPGTVVVAEWHGGYGRMVEIDHGYGLKTRYAHLSAISVVPGQKVEYGQKVGALGSTGRSTGPHLHYEVWYDGQARNPWNYLKAGADVLQRQGT